MVRRQAATDLENEQWQLMDPGKVELGRGAIRRRDLGLGVPEKCFVSGDRIDSVCMGNFEGEVAENGEGIKVEAAAR